MSNEKVPMSAPNTPNGIAGPDLVTHSPAKNVQEKLTIALMQVTATKQSAERGP
jgi:hypothetical protein